jgi:hypothetical protein
MPDLNTRRCASRVCNYTIHDAPITRPVITRSMYQKMINLHIKHKNGKLNTESTDYAIYRRLRRMYVSGIDVEK